MTRSKRLFPASPRSRRRTLRRWHRGGGLLASVFLMVLAVTGVMLNHSSELGLGSRQIRFAPLLAWYGIEGAAEVTSFRLGESWVSCVGDGVYLDLQPLSVDCPVGAVGSAGMWVVATPRELVLLTEGGELIERLGSAAGVPAEISALGREPGGAVVVDTPDGLSVADQELLRWSPQASDTDVSWSRPAAIPPDLRGELLSAYRGSGLSVERLVQDLHSGRLFGRWGVYAVDAAALLCLVLVVSGLALWRQGRRKSQFL